MLDGLPSRRVLVLLIHTFVTFGILAASSLLVAKGRAPSGIDFTQDYVSARSWLDGDSAYRPLDELLARYERPTHSTHLHLKSNPHPPVAVLLTLPYARLDFESALVGLWWTQLFALAVAWSLGYEVFQPAISRWAWTAGGGAFGLWAPLWQGMAWGHPVGVLALGTIAIWSFGRTERPFAFGFTLASIILIRPFFAMHIVLACGWTFRQQVRCVAGLFVGGLLPFAILGVTPWEWYKLASHAGGFVTWNGSIPSVLELGPLGAQVLYAAATAVLALFRWRGTDTDTTIALTAVIALLFYPLAWPIYDVSLLPVVAWLVSRAAVCSDRTVLLGVVIYVLLRTLPDMKATEQGNGLAEFLARNKTWLQLFARGVLLMCVVRVSVTARQHTGCHREDRVPGGVHSYP